MCIRAFFLKTWQPFRLVQYQWIISIQTLVESYIGTLNAPMNKLFQSITQIVALIYNLDCADRWERVRSEERICGWSAVWSADTASFMQSHAVDTLSKWREGRQLGGGGELIYVRLAVTHTHTHSQTHETCPDSHHPTFLTQVLCGGTVASGAGVLGGGSRGGGLATNIGTADDKYCLMTQPARHPSSLLLQMLGVSMRCPTQAIQADKQLKQSGKTAISKA